jgi:hydroxymethylglutaryl-CoA lyase
LLDAGFRNIDLGMFAIPETVPQLADSYEVVRAFQHMTHVEKIALIANDKGMDRAFAAGGLDALGYPFSFSRQFQMLNTRTTITQVWPLLERVIARIEQHDISFVLYVSMAFGNPYGERWDDKRLFELIHDFCNMGIRHISLADTAAVATPEQVSRIFQRARAEHPLVEFSAHFHTRHGNWF